MSEIIEDLGIIGNIIGKSIDYTNGIIPHRYFQKMRNWYKYYYWAYKGWPHTIWNMGGVTQGTGTESGYPGADAIPIPTYIAKHPRETKEMYEARLSRIWPVNFSRAVINKTITAVWTENVVREGLDADDDFSSFVKNCDLMGTSIDKFMKFCARMTYVHGFHLVLVDSLPAEAWNVVKPLGTAAKRMEFPYLSSYNANCIVDWGYDAFRQLRYVILLEQPDEYTYQYGQPMINQTYRLVTPENIYLIQQERVIDTKGGSTSTKYKITKYNHILSDYGIMPIAIMVNEDDKRNPFGASSGISDLAKADQAIINYISLRDEVFYDQTFGQLIIQANQDDDIKEINTGTSTVIRYPEGMQAPQYIAPPPQVVDGLNSGIESAITQIQRITDQRFSDSGADTSAQSKQWDFHNQEFSIVSMAKVCELAENDIWRILALSTRKIKMPDEEPPVTAAYGDAFDLKGARQFIDDFTALTLSVALPPTAKRVGSWNAITKLLPNLSEDDKKKIKDELKKQAEFEEEMGPAMMMGANNTLNPFNLEDTVEGMGDNNNQGIPKLKKPDNRLAKNKSSKESDDSKPEDK
jgi:hypothetical protein